MVFVFVFVFLFKILNYHVFYTLQTNVHGFCPPSFSCHLSLSSNIPLLHFHSLITHFEKLNLVFVYFLLLFFRFFTNFPACSTTNEFI